MSKVVAILPGQELVEALEHAKGNPQFRRGLIQKMIPAAYRKGYTLEWKCSPKGRLWLALKAQGDKPCTQ